MPNANPYKQLKPVSRQALTNFVNLKSNTIMKKPQCKCTDFSIIVKSQSAKLCFSTPNKTKRCLPLKGRHLFHDITNQMLVQILVLQLGANELAV